MPETIKVGFSNPYAKPKKSPSTISVNFSNPYDEEKEPDRETDKGNFFDSLPAVFKQAYNESLGGIMYQMMEGKKRFDLSQAPESFARDITAGILSFFASPQDLALTFGTMGAGRFLAKGAMKAAVGGGLSGNPSKRAAALLRARGGLSSSQANKIVKDVVDIGAPQAFMLGAHDGLYDAAREARDNMLEQGIDFEGIQKNSRGDVLSEVMKNAKLSKFGQGFALGGISGAARLGRLTKLGKITGEGEIAATGLEIASFAGLSPVVYEGRAPEFQDFVAAAGIVGGLGLGNRGARAVLNRRKNLKEQKLVEEAFGSENIDEILEESYKIEKRKGDPTETIAFEQVAPTRIEGIRVESEFRKGRRRTREVDRRRKKEVLSDKDMLSSVTVVPGSFRLTGKGATIQINTKMGPDGTLKDKFFLDEVNTEKLFRYYAETDNVTAEGYRIANRLTTASDLKKNRNIYKEMQIAEFDHIKGKMAKGQDGYSKDDFRKAVLETANQLSSKNQKHPFVNELKKSGAVKDLVDLDSINIRKVDSVTRKFLVDNMYERNQINNYIKEAKKIQADGLIYQTIGGRTRDNTSGVFRAFEPFYYQVRDKKARRLIRNLQTVNRNTQQKTDSRLNAVGLAINGQEAAMRKPTKKLFREYVQGTGKRSAFDDFKKIEETDGMTVKKFVKDLRKKADNESFNVTEKEFLYARANMIEGISKVTDDIYSDAQNVLPRLQDYIEGYVPMMFKRETLDLMMDGLKTINQKKQILLDKFSKKYEGTLLDNLDDDFPPDFLEEFNEELKTILKSFGKGSRRQREFKKVFEQYSDSLGGAGATKDDYEVFRLLEMNMYDNTLKPFSPLERPRKRFGKGDVRDSNLLKLAKRDLLETDITVLMGNYISGASKRVEFAKAFGSRGEIFNQIQKRIDPSNRMPLAKMPAFLGGGELPGMAQTEADAVKMLKEIFTGEINYNGTGGGKAIEAFQSIGNLQMMGKISLGFAVIPNLTQTIISTMTDLGFTTGLKAIAKAYGPTADAGLRKRISQSGATLTNTIEEMLSYSPAIGMQKGVERKIGNQSLTSEFALRMTNYKDGIEFATQKTATLFSFINKTNQIVAASAFEESVKKLGRILRGDKVGLLDTLAPEARKNWARNKLNRLGLSEKEVVDNLDTIISGNYSKTAKFIRTGGKRKKVLVDSPLKEKMLRGMQKFSVTSQLQRDFTLDPYLFNDPYIKPLLLFKRFGYRQAQYAGNVLQREFTDGNVMPLLTLAAGGLAGGQFVLFAKEQIGKVLTGEEEYYARSGRQKLLETPEFNKIINNIAAVGSFGVVTDIVGDDDPISSLSFFLTPVVIDDIQRISRAYNSFAGSMETQYPENWDVPLRKAAVVLAPIGGGITSRVVRKGIGVGEFRLTGGAETEGMEADRVRARKRDAVRAIKDAIIVDSPDEAAEIMREFNKTYGGRFPSLRIKPSEVSYSQVIKDKVERLKKQREEVEFRG
jgi:hypothetical protein|tara:strand:+ start:2404 stop:6834 length:4431 start_codon:yes stop_codon:yes gene_type:complete